MRLDIADIVRDGVFSPINWIASGWPTLEAAKRE